MELDEDFFVQVFKAVKVVTLLCVQERPVQYIITDKQIEQNR